MLIVVFIEPISEYAFTLKVISKFFTVKHSEEQPLFHSNKIKDDNHESSGPDHQHLEKNK